MKTKLKNGFKKVKKWIKKHKVLTVFLILAAVVVGIYFRLQRAGQEMAAALSQMAIETGEVTYRDITSTVNATGYVRSDNSRSLTTTLMNLEVTDVNVEVGDRVTVGQALVSFDTEDIKENLADAQESLNVAQAQNGLTVKGAQRNLEDAVGSRDYQVTGARKDLDYSKTTSEEAVADYNDTVKDLEEKRKEEEERKQDRDDREKDMERAKDRLEKAQREQSGSGLSPDLLDQIDQGTISGNEILENIAGAFDTSAVTAAQAEYQAASADYSAAAADYEKAKAEREALESGVDAKKSAMDANYRTYDRAADTLNNTVRMQNSAVAGSQDSLTNSRLSASIGTQAQENQVETYEKQLEKGVLTSPISGTVTAVNVKEGDTYGGGVIVTIQDCEDFIVEAEIDEYDISDIEEGMKVLFKTDATREEQLEGEVIFVSPVPTAAAASSAMGSGSASSLTTGGGKATYQIKVAISTQTDRLRLGMTAKMNIVLKEVEHVLTVPYDAVQTDENGDTVVYVMEQTTGTDGQQAQEQRPVPVTVGTEGDYYVEVIGEGLAEGMEVVIPKEEAIDLMELMMMP